MYVKQNTFYLMHSKNLHKTLFLHVKIQITEVWMSDYLVHVYSACTINEYTESVLYKASFILAAQLGGFTIVYTPGVVQNSYKK